MAQDQRPIREDDKRDLDLPLSQLLNAIQKEEPPERLQALARNLQDLLARRSE